MNKKKCIDDILGYNIAIYNKETNRYQTYTLKQLYKYRDNLECIKEYIVDLKLPKVDDEKAIKKMFNDLSINIKETFYEHKLHHMCMHEIYNMYALPYDYMDHRMKYQRQTVNSKQTKYIKRIITQWKEKRRTYFIMEINDIWTIQERMEKNKKKSTIKIPRIFKNLIVDNEPYIKECSHEIINYYYNNYWKHYHADNKKFKYISYITCNAEREQELIKKSAIDINKVQWWFRRIFLTSLMNIHNMGNRTVRRTIGVPQHERKYQFVKSRLLAIYNAYTSSHKYVTLKKSKTTRNTSDWRSFLRDIEQYNHDVQLQRTNIIITI